VKDAKISLARHSISGRESPYLATQNLWTEPFDDKRTNRSRQKKKTSNCYELMQFSLRYIVEKDI